MVGTQGLSGNLRIKVGGTVVDVNDFEISTLNGMVRMDITGFRLHGSFDKEPTPEVKAAKPKPEPETPVLTKEQIIKEHGK